VCRLAAVLNARLLQVMRGGGARGGGREGGGYRMRVWAQCVFESGTERAWERGGGSEGGGGLALGSGQTGVT